MRAATLSKRTWAALTDAYLLIAWILVIALVQPFPDWLPGPARVGIWWVLPLLVEPLSIRFLGRTAGQGLLGLRVVSHRGTVDSLPRLMLRHASKLLFLGLSPLFVPFSPRRQALHDHLFGTSVVDVGQSAPSAPGPALRAPVRAFVVSLGISALAGTLAAVVFITLVVVVFLGLGLDLDPGGPGEAFFELVGTIVAGLAQFRVLFRGARGNLPGTGGVVRAARTPA